MHFEENKNLTNRERTILFARFGLNKEQKEYSLEEIAEERKENKRFTSRRLIRALKKVEFYGLIRKIRNKHGFVWSCKCGKYMLKEAHKGIICDKCNQEVIGYNWLKILRILNKIKDINI